MSYSFPRTTQDSQVDTAFRFGGFQPSGQQLQQQQQQQQHSQSSQQQQQQQQHAAQQLAAAQQQQQAHLQVNPVLGNPSNQQTSPKDEDKIIRKNKPGQRFGAKKKSWVWNWFVQDSNDSNVAVCDQCGKVITRLASDKGSPKKLSEHLKTHKLNKESVNERRPSSSSPLINQFLPTNHAMSMSTSSTPSKFQPQQSQAPAGFQQQRFISGDYDNRPYSAMKFHQDIMKFLTENKLPISVVKSHSFKQLIYDLRSDSINDLSELSTLYSSLIEVQKFDPSQGGVDENAAFYG